jgi:glycosyltransferase involved in cell wall biosynthesis
MKLSVIVPTYNHAPFIAQTIEGILIQKTNFDIEILIGDDASTDDNQLIIKECQGKYPDKIKAFLHEKNLGPIAPRELGGKNNVAFLFLQAKGEYIALCEGDDYWTDENKLQKQVDFLDQNPDYALVHHQLLVTYEDGSESHYFNPENQKETSSIEDLLKDETWNLGTASTVFRNVFASFPAWWMKTASGDLGIFLMATQFGKIKYFSETMGCYRKHKGGMTNIHTPQNQFFLRNRMEMFEAVNQYLDYRYDEICKKTVQRFANLLNES